MVTGGDGRLATALRTLMPDATFLSRKDYDVRSGHQGRWVCRRHKPSTIIHCAAVTDWQADPKDLFQVNVEGTRFVAESARDYSAFIVYLSTDHVYPGLFGNYAETDACHPITAYAWSKYCGEQWVRTLDQHLIIRGSWYGPDWKPEFGVINSYTSRVPVRMAARFIDDLLQARTIGVVNIGLGRRSHYEVALEANPHARPVLRSRVDPNLPFPDDVSLNTERLQRILHTVATGTVDNPVAQ